jgi:hypothetical protein
MKYLITFFLALCLTHALAQNQNRALSEYFSYALIPQNIGSSRQTTSWHSFFSADRQQIFRMKSPMQMTLASSASFKGENYWMGTMTTQSYNQGKLGTYYYWDVQGNLRESRMFLDIAGKNKRGLKLVFRRR